MDKFLSGITSLIAPNFADVKAQASAASDQLTLAFEVLIAEGAIACALLTVLVLLQLKKKAA
jgi:hypothetical protein